MTRLKRNYIFKIRHQRKIKLINIETTSTLSQFKSMFELNYPGYIIIDIYNYKGERIEPKNRPISIREDHKVYPINELYQGGLCSPK